MQLAYNSSTLGASVGSAILKDGSDSWFFISADYAFGQAQVDDTTAVVQAAGGKVLGNARFPFPSNAVAAPGIDRPKSAAKPSCSR